MHLQPRLHRTFLITLPDPSSPPHFPPPHSSLAPLPLTASLLLPTLGTLTPPPTFLLPSLTVPAKSLVSWWDLPDALLRPDGNHATGWEFRLRKVQEARGHVRGGDDMFALRWTGRAVGRKGLADRLCSVVNSYNAQQDSPCYYKKRSMDNIGRGIKGYWIKCSILYYSTSACLFLRSTSRT
jgi:hypothetical protein